MKKLKLSKLVLRTETVSRLNPLSTTELANVKGGDLPASDTRTRCTTRPIDTADCM